MARNELLAGQSRVGFAWDEKISEPYAAMLQDHEGEITLTIPFDGKDERHFRRYAGDSVKWGDDPDMTKFDYTLPAQIWFYDAHGFVALGDVASPLLTSWMSSASDLNEARVRVGYAVFGGVPGINYSRINGMTTRIEGLRRWYGHRSVSHNLHDVDRNRDSFDITIHRKKEERIDQTLNLSIIAGVDWQLPGEPGRTHVEEIGAIRTTASRRRPWADHVAAHRSIHRLLEASCWQALGFENVQAMHSGDPERVLSGRVVGDRWAVVHTYALPPGGGDSAPEFLFGYSHIGAAGVRRWLRLLKDFNRGIHAMTFSIRHGGTSLEGLISDQGIGLESIGHTIALQNGGGGRRGHHAHLEDIAAEIEVLLPFDGATWASESTSVYNDVKHADRRDPNAEEMYWMSIKNRLVFRVWLAKRLGVPDETIKSYMWRMTRGLPD